MNKNLVIVESPAKVKTISKFLGNEYVVEASYGHVIDLPKSTMGVDVDNDFDCKYITIRGKGKLLTKLKRLVKSADNIYLATDPDREGETISWHLKNSFKLNDNQKLYRISFNEITKNAVTTAINNPRELDQNLVNSQQARRSMDRIVGYSISPILWEKIKRGLSAGRVQSVALKLICDREKEINSFVPEEYWTFDIKVKTSDNDEFSATLYRVNKEKPELNNKESVDKIKKLLIGNTLEVVDVKKSQREKKPPLPFTTSSLQQVAGKTLNFPVAKTMRIAQKLYEGVELKGKGTTSLITYLRTDSTRISDEAIASAKDYIEHNIGHSYVSDIVQKNQNENKVQDAHEAIRPTYIDILPDDVKDSIGRDEYRLYNLIWKRFIASRMNNAVYDTSKITLENNGVSFNANRSKIKFDGFMKVYKEQDDEDGDVKSSKLIDLNVGDKVTLSAILDEQHFTLPPAHYTESNLVKTLEEDGIGRPSTYAPTIQTLLKRRYITREKKNLFVTEIGLAVNDVMNKSFVDIVDEKFTANMEKQLDDVENGTLEWKQVLRDFYPNFKKEVDIARESLEKIEIKDEVTEEKCEKCGAYMVVKYGPYGKFLACPNFPDCRFTKNYIERTGYICPKCGKAEIIRLRTKKGRIFYGCENRDCDYQVWQIPKDAKKIDESDISNMTNS